MSIVTNIVSRMFANKSFANKSFLILTYFDISEELTETYIKNYVNELIKNNPILKQNMKKINNDFFLCDNRTFDIAKCFTIKYSKKKKKK